MDSKDIEHLYKEAKARGEIITLVTELEKENKLLKARNEELNENCYGLAKENKELKNKLDILYHHV